MIDILSMNLWKCAFQFAILDVWINLMHLAMMKAVPHSELISREWVDYCMRQCDFVNTSALFPGPRIFVKNGVLKSCDFDVSLSLKNHETILLLHKARLYSIVLNNDNNLAKWCYYIV